jgi:hypothetical protein
MRTSSLPVLAFALAAGLASSAQGQTSPPAPAAHPPVPAASLISVNDCNPKLNYQQYGPAYVGYAPGLWRGGYWGDVYGFNYYQPAVASANPQLAIHYMNISPKTMTAIEFGLVANGVLVAEVRDVGTFSPHAEIKHRFALNPNVFPIRTGLPQCVPLHITFADGTKWRNPGLPPKNHQIYFNP